MTGIDRDELERIIDRVIDEFLGRHKEELVKDVAVGVEKALAAQARDRSHDSDVEPAQIASAMKDAAVLLGAAADLADHAAPFKSSDPDADRWDKFDQL
jgi:hypothetical protein